MGRKSRLKKLKKHELSSGKSTVAYTSPKVSAIEKKLKKYHRITRVMNIVVISLIIVLSFSIGFGGWAYYFEAPIEAKVGNAVIKTEEVEKRLLALKNQYKQYGIDPEDPQYASLFVNARVQILEKLIEDQLIFQYGKDNKLKVTTDELSKRVDEELENYKKSFKDETEFEKFLKNSKLTIEGIKENLSKELEVNMTVEKVLEEKLKDVKVTKEDVYSYYNELYEVQAKHLLAVVEEGEGKTPEEAVQKLAEKLLTELKEKAKESNFNFASFSQEKEKEYEGRLKYEDLGFFAKGKMVIEFQEAAFSLKDGEISQELVKTKFGYHIIHRISHHTRKVTFDEPEEREVYRILFSLKSDVTPEEEEAIKKSALDVLGTIKKGSKFEDIAKEFSQDETSKEKGGLIGYVKKGTRGQVFDDFVFNAKVGEVVKEPLKTTEGLEILKVSAIKPFKESNLNDENIYKKVEEELLTNKKNEAKESFLEELTKKYRVKRGNLWNDFRSFIFGNN